MKKTITLIIALTFSTLAFSQKTLVNWYTIEEAEKLIKDNPRPIFIDAYTDWCGWCKKLDKDTFSNPVIAEILNTKFYPVKFDAEGKREITFQGKKYINDGKSGATHQLALSMLQVNGQIGYPTVVFLNDKGQLLSPVPGYKEPKDMEVLLSFFSEKAYEKQKWEDFQKTFNGRVK